MRVDLLLMLLAFFAATFLALLLGAPNTAQAATYGVIVFAITTVTLMVRRP